LTATSLVMLGGRVMTCVGSPGWNSWSSCRLDVTTCPIGAGRRDGAAGDTVWGVDRRRKGTVPTWAALKSIRAGHPDGTPGYVILDYLSAHKNGRMRRWATRNKVELCLLSGRAWNTPGHTGT
jgi:hypothetical protein